MNKIVHGFITYSYWYFVPILLFNIFFAPKLTSVGYLTKKVDLGLLGVLELALRIVVFAIPIFIWVDYEQAHIKKYIVFFCVGTLLYFATWLMIIYLPDLTLTKTWWIQLGPAYLPLIWLIAFAFMGKNTRWFIPISMFFVTIHTISTYLKLKG